MTDPIALRRPYDDTAAAMQHEMLAIDEEYAEQWVSTMRKLVDDKLDPDTFTKQRMLALRSWERRRKAAQARLRWKYAIGRRKSSLIERDVKAQLAQLRERLEQAKRAVAIAQTTGDQDAGDPPVSAAPVHAAPETGDHRDATKPRPARARPVRSLEGVDERLLQLIERETGMNPVTTSDEELRAFYTRIYMEPTEIDNRLRILNSGGHR